MSLDTAIQRWRTRQAALIRGTGTLRRPDPNAVIDLDTGLWSPQPTEIYSGAGDVGPNQKFGSKTQANEQTVIVGDFLLGLPVDTDAQVNDEWTVDSSTYDAGLVGQTFRVVFVPLSERQVYRQCGLELVSGLAQAEVGS